MKKNIHELGKLFYELPMALAYIRQNKWRRGLKLFDFIFNHFNQIDEDQLDFFSFALRKYSLMQFVEMVRLNQKTIGESNNFILGNAYYLKYAMAFFRNEKLEKINEENAPKMKASEIKKKKKTFGQIFIS